MVTQVDRDYNAEQQIAQKQSESKSFKIKYCESADFCFGIVNVTNFRGRICNLS